ncbi:MAG: TetR family transcriptional regulator [Frankiales bacterium]|nr:TetR family transcriptional regulator [Frankiales bacterium]
MGLPVGAVVLPDVVTPSLLDASSRSARSGSARREELLEAATRIVQRDGVHASMASIAAEAGITKPVLYRHFGDKGGLYAALADRVTDRLMSGLQAALATGRTPHERVALTIDAYLAMIEGEPQTYRFLVHSTEAAPAQGQVRSFLRRLSALLADGIAGETGLAAGSVRSLSWGHGIVGMVQAAGDWWLDERPCPRAELTRELTALLWGAYGAATSREEPRPADG